MRFFDRNTPNDAEYVSTLSIGCFPIFQLMTVFLCFPVCATFQPFHKLMFHHQFSSADPQSWKIRAVQKVVCPRFGNLQRSRKLLCIHYIRHGFKWLFAHKNLLSCMKKQPRFLVTAMIGIYSTIDSIDKYSRSFAFTEENSFSISFTTVLSSSVTNASKSSFLNAYSCNLFS